MIYEKLDEIQQLHKFLQSQHVDDTGIVYCLSRSKVERVTDELNKLGYEAVSYHAGLSSQQRQTAQRRFKTEYSIIVVATIAFGMGIDRPDVRFVAHLDLPKSIEGYYQETGRAGRDGEPSSAWMVFGLSDVVKLSRMIESTDASEHYKKISRAKLDAMLALCESLSCRRRVLLNYFGQLSDKDCGYCDACLEPQEQFEGTVVAQKLLSTIYKTGQTFGAQYVIDVLRGSQNQKIKSNQHDQLSVFAIGKDLSKNEWNGIVRQLLTMGYIQIKDWEYRTLSLTEKCRPLLKGDEALQLRKLRGQKSNSKTSSKKTRKTIAESHGKPELFEQLRALRLKMAKDKKVPPYVIFSDKSLHDMCSLLPANKEQMLMVHGVGQAKCDNYGEAFLKVISDR
jgi:ATP-dependent DNA helicase RecQ